MGQQLAARIRQNDNQRAAATPAVQNTGDKVASTPTIGQVIARMQGEIARALPKHMDAERMARLALTAVRKTPKLARCTPESFAGALLTSAALGLEPGVNDECYLVPYEDRKKRIVECQLIIGYQGYAKQFYQSPLAAFLDAQAVRANDAFDYEYGTDKYLRHKPARGDRGEVTDYYAVAKLTTGATHFVVLSPEEIRELRRGKEGPSGDIPDPQRWMERKTAIRQLVKLLPKSATLAAVVAADERSGGDLFRERLAERGADDSVIDVPAIDNFPDSAPPDMEAKSDEAAPEARATAAQVKALEDALKRDNVTTSDARLEWVRNAIHNPELATLAHLTGAQAEDMAQFLAQAQAADSQKSDQ